MSNAATTAEIVRFTVGQKVSTRSACDHECVWEFEILARSAKFVTVMVDGERVRRGIRVWRGVESFMPFGSYSMAPVVRADRAA